MFTPYPHPITATTTLPQKKIIILEIWVRNHIHRKIEIKQKHKKK